MSDDAAGDNAINELNGATIEGRSIKVTVAKPKEERPARQGRPSYSNEKW
jgi:RNA recognition motif-containing protein